MLLDMAVSEMVSWSVFRRRLGYGIETRHENARSRFTKLYSYTWTVADAPVHGWEYRRYVVSSIEKLRGVSLAKTEFDYTTTKTNNISNFSAWHNRAMLIPQLLPPTAAPNFETERKTFLEKGARKFVFIWLTRRIRTNAQWTLGRSRWSKHVVISFMVVRRDLLPSTTTYSRTSNPCSDVRRRESVGVAEWDTDAGRTVTRGAKVEM